MSEACNSITKSVTVTECHVTSPIQVITVALRLTRDGDFKLPRLFSVTNVLSNLRQSDCRWLMPEMNAGT